ncbi:MAG: TolC family protein [Rhodoferax sp.]
MAALRMLLLAGSVSLLGACASVSPDAGLAEVQTLSQPGVQGVVVRVAAEPDAAARATVDRLLQAPLDIDAAVQIALLNNPGLQSALATLGLREADRAQAGSLGNPHLSLGRMVEGDKVEIERALRFNLMDLLTLPWRTRWAGQQAELARLQAAQEVVRLAADTRKAWIQAVAARQSAAYQRDVQDAAEAGAELARRMARVGNLSRLNQAREQSFLAEATAQRARAEQVALASREHLIRLLGLWGTQTAFTLPDRLPDLPASARELQDVEAQAIAQRLDVRSAVREAVYVGDSLGVERALGFINALDLKVVRNTTFDAAAGTRETLRGTEIELPLPIFDWGQARHARAQAVYAQAVARVRDVGVRARSEARESYHAYRTAYDLARHYRDEVVPLRRFINDEVLLRYNGMISGIFDLLADARTHVGAINASLEAQRDFWLADTDLHTTLSGTSPGAMARLQAAGPAGAEAKGH